MRRRILAAGLGLLLSAGVAGATTLVRLDFADLVRQSDRVVLATVTGLEGRYEETGTFIHTDVTLEVERDLIGDGPGRIVVRTPGGQVGSVAMAAWGAPTFRIGEHVLVFLTTWEDGTPKVLGYSQGKASVVEDADGMFRLEGGAVNGRSLDGVVRELAQGPDHNIPLRPVR